MRVLLLLLLPAILMAQAPAASEPSVLQLRIVQSSGPVHILGSRSASVMTIAVTDAGGSPVPGAVVSFQLPPSGPGGLFGNGLTTDVAITTADGRAAASAVRWNRVAGPADIRVTAAKGGLRASIVSQHRLLASVTEANGAPAAASMRHGRRKIVLIVAGLAAGSVAAGLAMGRRTAPGASPASSVSLSVGTPTITVGGP